MIILKYLKTGYFMAKKDKNTNLLLVLLVVISILIFAASFFVGYFFREEIFGLFGPKFNVSQETSSESEFGVPELTSSEDLPDEFPGTFPVYQNAELENSWTASGNATKGISVIWSTGDSVSDVYEYYLAQLEDNSWEILSQFQEEDSNTITFEKEGVSGFVGITTGEEGKTLISVTMGIGG